MKLETAIKRLKANYEKAINSDYVIDKVAWALHKTWREADKSLVKKDKDYEDKLKKRDEGLEPYDVRCC